MGTTIRIVQPTGETKTVWNDPYNCKGVIPNIDPPLIWRDWLSHPDHAEKESDATAILKGDGLGLLIHHLFRSDWRPNETLGAVHLSCCTPEEAASVEAAESAEDKLNLVREISLSRLLIVRELSNAWVEGLTVYVDY